MDKGLEYGRFYDVPDETTIRQEQMEKTEAYELSRDRTFEEFMEMF